MSAEEDYTDTSTLGGGEPIEVESENYEAPAKGYVPTLPGKYNNPKRELIPDADGNLVRKQKDGHYGLLFKLTGGLVANGRTRDAGDYAKFKYINSRPNVVTEWNEDTKRREPKLDAEGKEQKTSEVAQYLRLFDESTKGLTPATLAERVLRTLDKEVGVRNDWTEQTQKTGEKRANGKDAYFEPKLKTWNFNVGTKEAPRYSPEVTGFLEDAESANGKAYKKFVASSAEGAQVFKATNVISFFTWPVKASS